MITLIKKVVSLMITGTGGVAAEIDNMNVKLDRPCKW